MSEARTKLAGFIRRELAQGRSDVDIERDSLVESGIIDSLGIMKLVDFIEKEFRVKIGDADLVPENFETIEDITKLLAAKK